MRRVAVVITFLSASALACGGLLGFGDDDELPVPTPTAEAGADATTADGGTTIEPLPPGCTRRSLIMGDAGDVDAALLAQGWNSNVVGSTSLAIEDGRLVVRSPVGNTTNEANVSFRHDGKVARITCTTNIEVSSFAGRSRFVWIRLFDPQWVDYYSAYAEWFQGNLRASIQGTFVDAGADADPDAARPTIDVFPPVPAPPAGKKLPLVVEYVRSPTSFRVKLGDAENAHQPTSPGNPDVARIIFGAYTPAGPPSDDYETRFDDIECIVCDEL